MVDISLLPKEEELKKSQVEKPTEGKAKGIFPTKFLFLGILIIIITGGITFGIFIYRNAQASNLQKLENSVSLLKGEETKYTKTETEAKILQSQLNNLQNLINKHKYWSGIMETLAGETPINIQYKSIVCEEKNNKFTVTGFANNYESIARLMVSLRKATTHKKTSFDSIELDSAKLGFDENKQIKVEFSISFNLKKDALITPFEIYTSAPEEQKNIVYIEHASWNPPELKIKVGEEVTWINNSDITHNVIALDNSFSSSNINPGQSYKHTFDKKGIFEYYCSIHSHPKGNTKGKIIVE